MVGVLRGSRGSWFQRLKSLVLFCCYTFGGFLSVAEISCSQRDDNAFSMSKKTDTRYKCCWKASQMFVVGSVGGGSKLKEIHRVIFEISLNM